MKRGRQKTPTVLAKLHGNPTRRPLPVDEPQGVGDLWATPAWFDEERREAWAYAIEHTPPGLLTGTDRGMLIAYVAALVEFEHAAREVQQLGQVMTTKDGHKLNPHMRVMNATAHIMIRTAGELGFSPSARAGLGSRAPEFNPHGTTPATPAARSRLQRYLDRKPDRQLDA